MKSSVLLERLDYEEEIEGIPYLALCITCLVLGLIALMELRYCLSITCLLFSNAGIYTFILANWRRKK